MKIRPEHYSLLNDLVEASPIFGKQRLYIERGHSLSRYRWNCVWSSKLMLPEEKAAFFRELYKYLNDTNIEAALRKITGTK